MEKGKAFGNRKKEEDRPIGDFYATPKCLIQELLRAEDKYIGGKIFPKEINDTILDPCCGKYAIGNVIRDFGFEDCVKITERDLMYGDNFLADDYGVDFNIKVENYQPKKYNEKYDKIIMNPPFKFFNDFVKKSKLIADKVYCIGKMDYFCTHDRNVENLWEHLEYVLPFDRKVAYDKPWREDSMVDVGMMNSCWFVWNKHYNGHPKIQVIDVDKYVIRKSNKK